LETEDVTRSWRKINNKKLHGLYSSPDMTRMAISRRMGRKRHVACMREKKKARQPERKSQVGRCITRWTNGIKMNLKRTGWKGVDQIHLAQDRKIRQLF